MSLIVFLTVIACLLAGLAVRGHRLGESSYSWVYILFFFSGFPALIYQIVWQRSLFEIYGVNIESVTIVVTAFMLGLGIGSMLGGYVSKLQGVPLLAVFGVVELGIAAYGFLSLRIFHFVALYTAGSPTLVAGVFSFLLVLVPTSLMGGTLPLLVEHLVRKSSNVGHSVGVLYFVNTLGSAVACFVAAGGMMRVMGLSGSCLVAAVINVGVGLAVLLFYFFSSSGKTAPAAAEAPRVEGGKTWTELGLPGAMIIACFTGFIALGYEILWYRLFFFATGGLAKSFALLLGSYLAGIAFGALFAEWFCRRNAGKNAQEQFGVVGMLVVFANLVGFLAAPLLANTVPFIGLLAGLLVVLVAAMMLGATFPLVAHLAIPPERLAGKRLSYLYVSNIVGSASGSFVVGFILMNYLSMRQVSVLLALAGLSLGIGLVVRATRGQTRKMAVSLGACAVIAATVVVSSNILFDHLYEKLLFKQNWLGDSFHYTVETRSGVINVAQNGTVYGGGIYDGHFNVDPMHDSNWIIRAYAVSALHPHPEDVLMIGLSSGSWAQVIANNPEVKTLTIVEINPGYMELIPRYREVAGLLRNPKVRLYVDDGRRWLRAHPDQKFDMIVMNTTYHFRANASSLLSTDFLQIVRKHLKPGGIHYYNTTESTEVLRTGATVFPYSVRFFNFLAVSDSPIQVDADRWRRVLTNYTINGQPVLHLDREADRKALDKIVSFVHEPVTSKLAAFEPGTEFPRRFRQSRIITDDNMGTEWYY